MLPECSSSRATTNIGAEDTTAPYAVSWNTTTVANGPYTLTAVARDAGGNTTTSTIVNVTVNNADTTAPTVSITAPANNATVQNTVTVSANAADNVGVVGVQFKVDGTSVGAEDTDRTVLGLVEHHDGRQRHPRADGRCAGRGGQHADVDDGVGDRQQSGQPLHRASP